jgi:hypothetical protein
MFFVLPPAQGCCFCEAWLGVEGQSDDTWPCASSSAVRAGDSTHQIEERNAHAAVERVMTEPERDAIRADSHVLRDRQQGLLRQKQTQAVQHQIAAVRLELAQLEVRLKSNTA